MNDKRARVRELAAEHIGKGDPLGWFEKLYQEAERGDAAIPWADLEPNPRLIEFWKAHPLEAAGKGALVIGSGLGDDAEQLAVWGFKTTGFDISKTAIEAAKKRFPKTQVEYVVADMFNPPANWLHGFDFVLEIYTVQSLPEELRAKPLLHFSCGFIGEGKGHDFRDGQGIWLSQEEVEDAIDEDRGLAGPGSRDHHDIAVPGCLRQEPILRVRECQQLTHR